MLRGIRNRPGARPGWRLAWCVTAWLGLVAVSPALADWDEIRKRGVLRVVTDDDPSTAFDNEVMAGFLQLHGLKMEMLRDRALAERIPLVTSGQADVAMSLFVTEERQKVVDFTVEVLPTAYTMATCRPSPAVSDVAELPRRRVGLLRGSIMEEAARRAGVPAANLVGFPEIRLVIEALCAGRVDVALVAMPDLAAFRTLYPGLEYRAPIDRVRSAAWAVRKDNPQLKAVLDDYLTNIRRSGSWSRLVVKHYGEQALTVLGRIKTP